MRSRILAAGAAVALLTVACGNAGSSKGPVATPTTQPGAPPITEATGATLQKNVHLTGVQGVTDSQINVAVITAGSNPLAGNYTAYVDGIQAYFDMINSQGGIYGRKLVISANHNDGFVNNQQTVKTSLANDHAFATFIASPLFYGAPDIAKASNMPTFIWNINQEFAGKPNIFGNVGALCFTCVGQGLPFLAQSQGFKKVGVLAYGSPAASKNCALGIKNSFTKYPSATVAYFNDDLQIGQPDLSAEVSAMKSKGVQLIATCMDQAETLILAKELAKQHLNAVQNLPNSYDSEFAAQNGKYFEGSFVAPQFASFEYKPLLPVQQQFLDWMAKDHKKVFEIPAYGWINALQLVTGLKLAGPNFSQQKVINSLNQETSFDADGFIQPIDWTKQHNDPSGPNGSTNAAVAGKYNCASTVTIHNGKLTPLPQVPSGKQWICMTGGPNAPTLTKTPEYMRFGPS
jgi:ABC-type branched-subunit amino acid transport system substrate-binding protein